jgi:HAD superfamily hydrolase (TIGR01484 family)
MPIGPHAFARWAGRMRHDLAEARLLRPVATAGPSDRWCAGAPAMSGQQGIRLLVSDVDGTLVTHDKVLTEAAKAAARELHQAGIAFAITSSRPPRGLRMLIEPLALQGSIAGFNGGLYVNPDLSVIRRLTLDPAAARQAVDLIVDHGLDVWVYTQDEWLIRDRTGPHVAREAWILKFDATVVTSFTHEHLAHAIKIVGVSDDFDRVATCEKLAQDALGEKASAVRSQTYFLDVTHPQANKGAVVTTLSDLLDNDRRHAERRPDVPQERFFHRHGQCQR